MLTSTFGVPVAAGVSPAISSLACHAVALCAGGSLLTCDSLNNTWSHCGNSVPACSATMYLAYQSGQFASL
jgi:hypothetical protein